MSDWQNPFLNLSLLFAFMPVWISVLCYIEATNLIFLISQYYGFAKETDNCPEMGDTVDVSNAIKRYAKFIMLQNK